MKILDYENLIIGEKIFGLEIVDNLVKVLELKRSTGKFSVIGFGEAPVEPNSITNGVIVNKESVASAIKSARDNARPHKIRIRYASVVLPDSKIFVRVIRFPEEMSKEEVQEAVEWKAKDLIAMPLEKVYWDWHRLPSSKDQKEIEVLISAVERECVDSYTQTLKLLELTPLYYDISGNSVARFLFQKEYKGKKALLVRIDRSSTTLGLFLKGGVRYLSVSKNPIKAGYGALVDLAASKLNVDPKKAEKLILYPDNLNSIQKDILKEQFDIYFSGWLKEIEQIVEYYSQTLYDSKSKTSGNISDLEGIYLYGKGAKVFHLDEYFKNQALNVITELKSDSAISPIIQFISRQSLHENLVILGLSLRNLGLFKDLRDINLVPKGIKIRYLQRTIYNSLYASLRLIFWSIYIIGTVIVATFLMTLIYKQNLKKELVSVENITESRANKELVKNINYVNQVGEQLDTKFLEGSEWDVFFENISFLRGSGISFSNILVTEDTNAWRAISGDSKVVKKAGFMYVVITGTAQTREDLQRFSRDMESSPLFEDVRMPLSNFDSSTNIDFTLYCLLDLSKLKKG
jgi:type IV pilus assembly protein PilM